MSRSRYTKVYMYPLAPVAHASKRNLRTGVSWVPSLSRSASRTKRNARADAAGETWGGGGDDLRIHETLSGLAGGTVPGNNTSLLCR